jgi:hypothetical protein
VPGISVSVEVLVIAIVAGAAALALWLEVRFPKLAPTRPLVVFVHLVGSCVVARMLMPPVMTELDNIFLAIFVAVVPAIGYMCLSIIWLVKAAQRALSGGGGGGGLPASR